MYVLSKGAHSMRIIALPLARIKLYPDTKLRPSDPSANTLLIFYHFDLISPCGEHKDVPWYKQVLESAANKAANFWTSLGKGPKGSWKLWTYELGERMADRIEFEELALRNVDPSLGPTVPAGTSTQQFNDVGKDSSQVYSLPKIPLVYPPSLYPVEADYALHSPLAHLQTLLANRGPRHRRGFYLWMFLAPLAVPVTLIPIIPNLPLFFCVWRSWSHYRAYRASQYLSSLVDRGLIELNPSLELDKLYTSITLSSRISRSLPPSIPAPRSSEKTSTCRNAADGKLDLATTAATQSERILLTRGAVSQILEMFQLPEPLSMDICRALNQAHVRLGKSLI